MADETSFHDETQVQEILSDLDVILSDLGADPAALAAPAPAAPAALPPIEEKTSEPASPSPDPTPEPIAPAPAPLEEPQLAVEAAAAPVDPAPVEEKAPEPVSPPEPEPAEVPIQALAQPESQSIASQPEPARSQEEIPEPMKSPEPEPASVASQEEHLLAKVPPAIETPEPAPVKEKILEPAKEKAPEPSAVEPQKPAKFDKPPSLALPEKPKPEPGSLAELLLQVKKPAGDPAASGSDGQEAGAVDADGIPEDAGKDQIKQVAIVYTPNYVKERDLMVAFLAENALSVSKKPLYLRRVYMEILGPSDNAAIFTEKMKSLGVVAVFGVLEGIPAKKVDEVAEALAQARVMFRAIAPADVQNRALAVDIMVEMMLLGARSA